MKTIINSKIIGELLCPEDSLKTKGIKEYRAYVCVKKVRDELQEIFEINKYLNDLSIIGSLSYDEMKTKEKLRDEHFAKLWSAYVDAKETLENISIPFQDEVDTEGNSLPNKYSIQKKHNKLNEQEQELTLVDVNETPKEVKPLKTAFDILGNDPSGPQLAVLLAVCITLGIRVNDNRTDFVRWLAEEFPAIFREKEKQYKKRLHDSLRNRSIGSPRCQEDLLNIVGGWHRRTKEKEKYTSLATNLFLALKN